MIIIPIILIIFSYINFTHTTSQYWEWYS